MWNIVRLILQYRKCSIYFYFRFGFSEAYNIFVSAPGLIFMFQRSD